MAWISIEVDADGHKVRDIKDVVIMTDDDGEVALFETSDEADDWQQRHAKQGRTYWTEEIWG